MLLLRHEIHLLFILAVVCIGGHAFATEPNETFAEATILPAGVLSVDDDVAPGLVAYPDTVLASLDFLGLIDQVDDDSSIYGDGFASGLSIVSVNPGGTIDFLVSGNPDFGFVGDHGRSGGFEVVIDIYDFFGDYLGTFTEVRTLDPGEVESFSYQADFDWDTYDVNIDNTVGGGGSPADVDFYIFTGLTPGASFSAEVTQDVFSGFDSLLGWFDDAGVLIEVNDDEGVETLSLIEGVVPGNGQLAFAVTGFGDDDFLGNHIEDAEYSLEVSVSGTPGDFDGDGDVDGRDFLVWQRGGSPTALSAGDLANWEANYGPEGLAAVAVPEPTTLALLVAAAGGLMARRWK